MIRICSWFSVVDPIACTSVYCRSGSLILRYVLRWLMKQANSVESTHEELTQVLQANRNRINAEVTLHDVENVLAVFGLLLSIKNISN